jgi:hypothetical protein
MSQLPLSTETQRGYEPPRNTQFSVFLDNRVGKLLELMHVFEGQALQVAGFSVNDSSDHAVVRVVTSRSLLARRLLDRHKMPFSEDDVLVVELNHHQSMSKICSSLLSAELNIQYAFPLLSQPHGLPTLALHCDDIVMAGEVLLRKRFVLLGENDLGDNATHSSEGPLAG